LENSVQKVMKRAKTTVDGPAVAEIHPRGKTTDETGESRQTKASSAGVSA
jgi:hypothetical protein